MVKNNKTSYEGSKLDILTCSHGLHQLINEPANFLHSSSSCIDLIFTSQPNYVLESCVQPSLYPNCHHYLVFAKFDDSSSILHFMKKQYGTTTERILISSGDQLTCLTDIKHYVSMIWTNKLLFLVTL